ncbi:MAG: stage III sporulation protein AD [Tissierellaceae bacterium]|nr:stage III sporulation protein AD [Tissierellaceae bacterium]
MEIFQIVGIGIIATILVAILKGIRSDFAIYVSIVAGVIIFSMVIKDISYVISTIRDLSRRADLEITYFSTILKIIGTAYVVEFGSQISRDAGENSIAMKIELAGKIIIMTLAIPILLSLMDLIIKIIP